MSVQDWCAVIGTVLAVLAVLHVASRRWGKVEDDIIHLQKRLDDHPDCREDIAALRSRIDILVDMHVHRSMIAAVQKGVATMNSPIALAPHAAELLEPIAARLQSRYREAWSNLSDSELMMQIEKEFGGWIYQYVCLVEGFGNGEGIVIAAVVAGRTHLMGPSSDLPDHVG